MKLVFPQTRCLLKVNPIKDEVIQLLDYGNRYYHIHKIMRILIQNLTNSNFFKVDRELLHKHQSQTTSRQAPV